MALKILFDKGLTKMTSASNALADYKKIIGNNRFNHFYPELEFKIDEDIRSRLSWWIYLLQSKI